MDETTPMQPVADRGPRHESQPTADAAPTVDAEEVEGVPDATFIGQPAKVMRIGTMVKQLLEEVRTAPLDDAARGRLAEVHERSLRELEDGLSPDLVEELRRISLPFTDDNPTEGELRVAQAQLVGWLEGLFHGLQTALVAQQMATQAQLTQMRRALPAGPSGLPAGPGGPVPGGAARPGAPGGTDDERRDGTGQYL